MIYRYLSLFYLYPKIGTNCHDHGDTGNNFQNRCSADFETFDIPNFCQTSLFENPAYEDGYDAICEKFSQNEWRFDSLTGSCFISDCDSPGVLAGVIRIPGYGVDYGFGCCAGCCGFLGRGQSCKRIAFTGDPVNCCIEDLICNIDPKNCWSDPAHQQTCAPQNRNVTTSSCKQTMHNWCLGNDLNPADLSWLERWSGKFPINGTTYTAPCLQALQRNLYNTAEPQLTPTICGPFPTGLPPTATGFAYTEQLLANVIQKYTAQGFVLGSAPGTPGYNTFQDTIFNLCQTTPGVCQNFLKNAGSNLNTTRLTQNPVAAQFFGCYLPDAEYTTYIDKYGVPKQCTPQCNRSGVIPLVAPDGVTKVPCSSSSCIIDNVTIALSQSNVGGSINFGQVCQNCSSSNPQEILSCSCLIEGTSVLVANSEITGNINFNQHCTGASQCFSTDSAGNRIQVNCNNGTDPYEQQIALQNQAVQNSSNTGYLLTIGIIVFVIILAILIYIILKNKST